jgi:hypothetical protein
MNQDQIEWLRTHRITRCPPEPEAGMSFVAATERDLIARYITAGKTLDMNADMNLVPRAVLAARRAKERKRMARKAAIDFEKLKELHQQGLSDVAIGASLGCSGVTIGKYRRQLSLPPGAKPDLHTGNGSSPQPKVQRKTARKADSPPPQPHHHFGFGRSPGPLVGFARFGRERKTIWSR